jgi:CRP-like cAMP-binding protein
MREVQSVKKPGTASLEILGFLEKQSLFNGLRNETLSNLAASIMVKKRQRGTYIFFQGDPADGVCILRSGAIAIVLDSPDGRELVINELRAGDCFGELAVITNQNRSTGALALKDCELLVIPAEAFRAALDFDAKLSRRIMELTAERLRTSSERESALAFFSAEGRLARVLLNLDRRESARGFVTISQEELAQRTGLTRQTVAKALGRWRRSGWLLTGRGRIMLLNRSALVQIQEQNPC